MVTSISGVARPRRARVWALGIAGVLILIVIVGLPPQAIAQSASVATEAAPLDPFAARQRTWDEARRPTLPTASPFVGRGQNVDFSPPESCENSCGLSSEQCFARCPGASAADRAQPLSGLKRPDQQPCQEQCLALQSSCLNKCGQQQRALPITTVVLPSVVRPNVLPPAPGPSVTPQPLEPGPKSIAPAKEATK
jgi:hypothetical protein